MLRYGFILVGPALLASTSACFAGVCSPEIGRTQVVVDETPVLLLKAGERIYAIHDRCSHRGCSLAEGNVEGHEIVCSCHFSRFDLRDGSVTRGPATAPQPAFQVRERDGVLEVRRVG